MTTPTTKDLLHVMVEKTRRDNLTLTTANLLHAEAERFRIDDDDGETDPVMGHLERGRHEHCLELIVIQTLTLTLATASQGWDEAGRPGKQLNDDVMTTAAAMKGTTENWKPLNKKMCDVKCHFLA